MNYFYNIKGSILVFAPFPPNEYSVSRDAADVVHCLTKAGVDVHTASGNPQTYCRTLVAFSPKRKFTPALKEILAADHGLTVFYPQALNFDEIRQTQWKKRRVEEFRRLTLLTKIGFQKPKAVIAFPTKQKFHIQFACAAIILLARLLRPTKIRLVRKKTRGLLLADRILGRKNKRPDGAIAETTVFKLANQKTGMQLSPSWLQLSIQKLSPKSKAREDLVQINALVKLLIKQPAPFQEPEDFVSTAPVRDWPEISNSTVPVSGFMRHLWLKHNLATRFDLETTAGRAGMLRWYLTRAPEIENHPLPLLKPVFEAFKDDCKTLAKLDHVRSLQPSDGRTTSLPAYFLSLHRCFPAKYRRFNLKTNNGRIAFGFQVIVDHARFQFSEDFIGESLRAFFTAPIGGVDGNLTRFDLLVAVLARATTSSQNCLRQPWKSRQLADWVQGLSQKGYPLLQEFCAPPRKNLLAKITVSGTNMQETGLGRNQIMSIAALDNMQMNRPVFLHHLNADEIPSQICRQNDPNAFHIGFLLWELTKTPALHNLANHLLDEIWVPSKFVQNIYENAFDRPVTMIGKGFDLPDVPLTDLGGYGIRPTDTVFLSCFDMHSSVTRKNPLAAVLAFRRAFPKNQNVRLLLKTTPAPAEHWGDPEHQMAEIHKIASTDPRIIIDQRMLSFNALLSLVRSVDCIMSTHRAEGFGYLPAYALKYAKPLIVTDYSGTKDFCTTETAFPVGFTLQDVGSQQSIFPVEGAQWAEIDANHLVQTLRQVNDDLDGAKQRAVIGQELMLGFYSKAALANRYDTRLKALGLTPNSRNAQLQYGKFNQGPINRTRRMPPSPKL